MIRKCFYTRLAVAELVGVRITVRAGLARLARPAVCVYLEWLYTRLRAKLAVCIASAKTEWPTAVFYAVAQLLVILHDPSASRSSVCLHMKCKRLLARPVSYSSVRLCVCDRQEHIQQRARCHQISKLFSRRVSLTYCIVFVTHS